MKYIITNQEIMLHDLLLKILLAYNVDLMDKIRSKSTVCTVYGESTRKTAEEEGISIYIVGKTLHIDIDISDK